MVAEEWGQGAATRLRAVYEDFRPVDGLAMPWRITVESPRVRLLIEITELRRNPALAASTFAF